MPTSPYCPYLSVSMDVGGGPDIHHNKSLPFSRETSIFAF